MKVQITVTKRKSLLLAIEDATAKDFESKVSLNPNFVTKIEAETNEVVFAEMEAMQASLDAPRYVLDGLVPEGETRTCFTVKDGGLVIL